MRVVLLGAVRPLTANRWKDDVEEAGHTLGWDVLHVNAAGIPTEQVVWLCRGADALIWARTHGHRPDGDVAGMLRRVEDAGTATVGLHLDLYWGIRRREQQIGVDPWWSCQWVFTADGGSQTRFAGRGVNHHWLPPAMGSRFLGRAMPAARYAHDAVFVGSVVRDIHGPHRRALVDWAVRRWGNRFARYGGGRQVWGAELSALYATAQVALGDSARGDRYWSDRLPCSLGRGALLAHPRVDGMDGWGFTDEVMVRYEWGCFDQIGQRLAGMSEADRAAMRDNALTLIRERHVWTHRLLDIQRVVFGAGADRVRRPSAQVGQPPRPAVASGAAAGR